MASADVPPVGLHSVAGPDLLEAIDTLGFGVFLLDGSLRVLDVSPRIEALLGRTAAELRSLRDPAPLIAAEQRYLVAERRTRLAAGDYGQLVDEVELLTADGERVPVQVSSSGVALPAGEFAPGLLVLCRDLRPSLAIDSSLSRLTTLAEVMPIGLLVWDGQGVTDPMAMRLAGANGGAERMLGVPLAGRLGATVSDLFPDADPVATARLLALAGTDRVESFGDAQYQAGLFSWQAAGLPDGTVGVIFEDVTRERAAEAERRALLERLMDTGDDERRRLAVAMHDDPVQKIAAATLLVEALRRHPDAEPPSQRLESIETTLRSAMAALRQLTFELSPPELVESGLEAALHAAVAYLFGDTGVSVDTEIELHAEPEPAVQTAAFRILAEALTNVRKHANASTVRVAVSDGDGVLSLSVADEGRGMDPQDEGQPGHLGLRTMRERAAALGGTLRVSASERGVSVEAALPLHVRSQDGAVGVDPAPPAPDAADSAETEILRSERDSLRVAVGEALERARIAESRLREAFGVTKAMLEPGLSRNQIASLAAEQLGRAMRDGCGVHLLETDGLRTAATWHSPASHAGTGDLAVLETGLAGGHLGTALRSGEAVRIDRLSLDSMTDVGADVARAPHSAIVAPLKVDDEVLGLVTVARDATDVPYDDDDLDLLLCLVDRVAIALSLAGPAPR